MLLFDDFVDFFGASGFLLICVFAVEVIEHEEFGSGVFFLFKLVQVLQDGGHALGFQFLGHGFVTLDKVFGLTLTRGTGDCRLLFIPLTLPENFTFNLIEALRVLNHSRRLSDGRVICNTFGVFLISYIRHRQIQKLFIQLNCLELICAVRQRLRIFVRENHTLVRLQLLSRIH